MPPARRSSSSKGAGRAAASDVGTQAADGSRDAAAGWSTLLLGIAISGFLLWRNRQPMGFEEYYILNVAMLLWPPMLLILLFLRRELSEFGMTPGDVKGGVIAALVMFALFIPVLLFIAPQPDPQRYYLGALLGESGAVTGLVWGPGRTPMGGRIDYGRLAFHELVFGIYMFAWEWFFRGFLLFGLKRIMPVVWAGLIQAALFGLLHLGKPLPEFISSFVGGLFLTGVAIRYRSFLPCFLVHYLISLSFDFAVLYFHFNR